MRVQIALCPEREDVAPPVLNGGAALFLYLCGPQRLYISLSLTQLLDCGAPSSSAGSKLPLYFRRGSRPCGALDFFRGLPLGP